MEFLDENLDEKRNADFVVTEQPDRKSTDLNKLLKVQGVRLYTDIWTPFVIFYFLNIFSILSAIILQILNYL